MSAGIVPGSAAALPGTTTPNGTQVHNRTVVVEPLDLPAAVTSADADVYLEYVAATNAAARHDSGSDLFDKDPAELLAWLSDTRYSEKVGLVARRGEQMVGFVGISWPRAGEHTANVNLAVRPELREPAITDALLTAAETVALANGRHVVHTFNFTAPQVHGERLASPTGYGSIPLAADTTQDLLRNGYELGQVERGSTFDLADVDKHEHLEHMLADALALAGADYRTVWWEIPTPKEYADGYARAITRMVTDIPSGELTLEEDPWDAARVLDRDHRRLEAGQTMAVTAVVHEPTGELVAMNELAIGGDRTRSSENYGTIVMPEHRGRRLGTIVKCLGLLRWRELAPASPVVETFNAEENRYMLDVNEAVGFEAVCWSGEWHKKLLPAPNEFP